jgi:hypothetical protein
VRLGGKPGRAFLGIQAVSAVWADENWHRTSIDIDFGIPAANPERRSSGTIAFEILPDLPEQAVRKG